MIHRVLKQSDKLVHFPETLMFVVRPVDDCEGLYLFHWLLSRKIYYSINSVSALAFGELYVIKKEMEHKSLLRNFGYPTESFKDQNEDINAAE